MASKSSSQSKSMNANFQKSIYKIISYYLKGNSLSVSPKMISGLSKILNDDESFHRAFD